MSSIVECHVQCCILSPGVAFSITHSSAAKHSAFAEEPQKLLNVCVLRLTLLDHIVVKRQEPFFLCQVRVKISMLCTLSITNLWIALLPTQVLASLHLEVNPAFRQSSSGETRDYGKGGRAMCCASFCICQYPSQCAANVTVLEVGMSLPETGT